MIPDIAVGPALHSLSTRAKAEQTPPCGLPTLLSAVSTLPAYQSLARKISFQALAALGSKMSITSSTCRLIDYSPTILFLAAKLLPVKVQPLLAWVQRHTIVTNQVISTVAAGILLAKGQRRLGISVLAFMAYHVACQRKWVSGQIQTIVNRTLFCAVSCYGLITSSSFVERVFIILNLADFLFEFPSIQAYFAVQYPRMPSITRINQMALPDTRNVIVNRNHILVKDSESEYHPFLVELAKCRTAIAKKKLSINTLLPSGNEEMICQVEEIICQVMVEGSGAMRYHVPFYFVPLIRLSCTHWMPFFWKYYYSGAMITWLVEHKQEALNVWASERGLKELDNRQLAKLLLFEMKVLIPGVGDGSSRSN